MAQDFSTLDPDDALSSALDIADEREETLRSTFSGSSAPTDPAPVEGQAWYDTDDDRVRHFNGTAWVAVSNYKLTTNTTTVGNVGTGEDDLMSYAVPAATLAIDGQALRFTLSGTFAANVNTKRIRLYWDGVAFLDTTALAINSGNWRAEVLVIRTGATAQKIAATIATNNALLVSLTAYATDAATLSGAVTFKATGEATSNNDIVQELLIAEVLP